jgi:8-oxo-dGTP pyrophosphatase MutT (NUDIX family)
MDSAGNRARIDLLALLRTYVAIDEADRCNAERIVRFIEEEPYAAARETVVGHLTGSAWVVNQAGDSVLLMHHRKLGIWVQPGGHADGEYDVAGVAFREASEETGLDSIEIDSSQIFDVDVHVIPEYRNLPGHLHFDLRFLCRADDAEPLVQSEESYNLRWIALEQLEQLSTEPSLLRMREKWLIRAR